MPKLRLTATSTHIHRHFWSPEQLQRQHLDWLSGHYQRAGLVGEITWNWPSATIVTELPDGRSGASDPTVALANAALWAAQSAALSPMEAVISDTMRTWAATAASAGLAGLAVGKDANPGAQALVGLAGFIGGGIAGWFIKAEVPIYQLQRNAYGQLEWVAVPLGSRPPLGLSFA